MLLSYGLLNEKHIDALCHSTESRVRYGGLILDESHHIKHASTAASKNALILRKKANPIYTVLLSGTPVENDFNELVGQFRMLAPIKFNQAWEDKFEEFIATPIRNFLRTYSIEENSPAITSIRNELSQVGKTVSPIIEDDEDPDVSDESGTEISDEAERLMATGKEVGKAFSYLLNIVDNFILKKSLDDCDMKGYFPNIAPLSIGLCFGR